MPTESQSQKLTLLDANSNWVQEIEALSLSPEAKSTLTKNIRTLQTGLRELRPNLDSLATESNCDLSTQKDDVRSQTINKLRMLELTLLRQLEETMPKFFTATDALTATADQFSSSSTEHARAALGYNGSFKAIGGLQALLENSRQAFIDKASDQLRRSGEQIRKGTASLSSSERQKHAKSEEQYRSNLASLEQQVEQLMARLTDGQQQYNALREKAKAAVAQQRDKIGELQTENHSLQQQQEQSQAALAASAAQLVQHRAATAKRAGLHQTITSAMRSADAAEATRNRDKEKLHEKRELINLLSDLNSFNNLSIFTKQTNRGDKVDLVTLSDLSTSIAWVNAVLNGTELPPHRKYYTEESDIIAENPEAVADYEAREIEQQLRSAFKLRDKLMARQRAQALPSSRQRIRSTTVSSQQEQAAEHDEDSFPPLSIHSPDESHASEQSAQQPHLNFDTSRLTASSMDHKVSRGPNKTKIGDDFLTESSPNESAPLAIGGSLWEQHEQLSQEEMAAIEAQDRETQVMDAQRNSSAAMPSSNDLSSRSDSRRGKTPVVSRQPFQQQQIPQSSSTPHGFVTDDPDSSSPPSPKLHSEADRQHQQKATEERAKLEREQHALQQQLANLRRVQEEAMKAQANTEAAEQLLPHSTQSPPRTTTNTSDDRTPPRGQVVTPQGSPGITPPTAPHYHRDIQTPDWQEAQPPAPNTRTRVTMSTTGNSNNPVAPASSRSLASQSPIDASGFFQQIHGSKCVVTPQKNETLIVPANSFGNNLPAIQTGIYQVEPNGKKETLEAQAAAAGSSVNDPSFQHAQYTATVSQPQGQGPKFETSCDSDNEASLKAAFSAVVKAAGQNGTITINGLNENYANQNTLASWLGGDQELQQKFNTLKIMGHDNKNKEIDIQTGTSSTTPLRDVEAQQPPLRSPSGEAEDREHHHSSPELTVRNPSPRR